MPAPVRLERLAIAQQRAKGLEARQETSQTGATPSRGVSRMRGGGAVPSLGLSQFHGGGMERVVGGNRAPSIRGNKLARADRRALEEEHTRSNALEGSGWFGDVGESFNNTFNPDRNGIGSFMNDRKDAGEKIGHNLDKMFKGSGTGGNWFSDAVNGVQDVVGKVINPLPMVLGKGRKRGGRTKKVDNYWEKHGLSEGAESRDKQESRIMGQHLGKHLLGLHGPTYHRDFAEGVLEGGGFFDDIADAFNPDKNGVGNLANKLKEGIVAPGGDPRFWNDFGHGFKYGMEKIGNVVQPVLEKMGPRGEAISGAWQGLNEGLKFIPDSDTSGLPPSGSGRKGRKCGGYKSGATEGKGMFDQLGAVGPRYEERTTQPVRSMPFRGFSDKMPQPYRPLPDDAFFHQKTHGGAVTRFDFERKVGGRKKRAPAGPSDGRRKRAEIVKQVMAEHGMKMIDASKYVKAHGLY